MYVRSGLLYLVSALKLIYAISVVLFKYSFVILPSSQKFRRSVVVIVNFCKFWNIRFSCYVKDPPAPGTPYFFFSSANAHALSSHRSTIA